MITKAVESIERASSGRILLTMISTFALSHTIYFLAGVRFDDGPLVNFWQYLDPELLRHDLLESCFYLHSQPPFFNLFLGAVLKLFPQSETAAFQGLYILSGLVLYLSVFRLLRRLGVSRAISLVVSTLFMVSPSFILYEQWLFYTFPLAAILTTSALLFHDTLAGRGRWAAHGFFVSLLLLCGIRSLFHLSYYLLMAGALIIACSNRRKNILLASLIPFLIVLSLYVKNLILFDRFTVSSWMGMNVWAITTRNVPHQARMDMVAEGKLSRISLVKRFSGLGAYPDEYIRVDDCEDIEALRQVKKSTGFDNFNHCAYLSISDRYLRDALYGLRHYPNALAAGLSRSWFGYFKSSSDLGASRANQKKIAWVCDLYDHLFYGKIPLDLSKIDGLPVYSNREHYLYLFLMIGLPLLVVSALWMALTTNVADRGLGRGQRILIFYLCFQILYVALVGNLFEVGENNRFRFVTDPLYLILFGLFLQYFMVPRLSRFRLRRIKSSRPAGRSSH